MAANGARFHVAEAGEGPAVVLVHGYPGCWWSWRHQLPALAAAGFRAVAVDVRGFGASDKPPRGYDLETAGEDLASLVRSLGEERAVFVGHGLGGWTCWFMAGLHPDETRAVAVTAMPHPATMRNLPWPLRNVGSLGRYRRGLGAPLDGERELAQVAPAEVGELLDRGSAPSNDWVTSDVVSHYGASLALPFVAHATEESFGRLRMGRRERRRLAQATGGPAVPVLLIHGGADPWVAAQRMLESASHVRGRLRLETIPDAGHFAPEETPDRFTAILIEWLTHL